MFYVVVMYVYKKGNKKDSSIGFHYVIFNTGSF